MEDTRTLINLLWVILAIGGIIWSISYLAKSVLECIYVFFTKTIRIRKKSKQIVTAVIKNKKYYEPRGSSKPSHTDIPATYEIIVDYEGEEYIITTNRKVYKNYEIDDSIDLLLIEFLDCDGKIISYNLKVHK